MDDLIQIPYNNHLELASLDITDMYPNKNDSTTHHRNNVNKKVEREIIKLKRILLAVLMCFIND
jgi:hypothetical protein